MPRIMLIIVAVFMASAAHAATLEIPGPNTTLSGIGFISGWKCRANGQLTVRFDGGRAVPLVYGSERGDTGGICGDTNNGFVATMNWGKLSDGRHTAVVYDNGVEFARSTFTVVTPGVEFLRGVTGSGTATLSNGQRVTLQWSEATQSFVATNYTDRGTTPPPPAASGVGQFLGTWRFTNSRTTQTYRFPRVEACSGEPCLLDRSQRAGLVEFTEAQKATAGYSYGLIQFGSGICRSYLLYEPNGNTVRGHYGFALSASCTSDAALRSMAEDIVLKRYPTTGTRISQSASQAFSLEVEEATETEENLTQEEIEDIEDAVLAVEEMLFLMME